ncbi:1-deoxy-D-xylulose-5-phosphate reductoisomerase [Patescibacteria group bacterium]
MPKNIIIIGSTGSIGTQALNVIRSNLSDFNVVGLSAYKNQELLDKQIAEFNPKYGGTLCEKKLKKMVLQNDVDIILFGCRGTDLIDVLRETIKANKHIAIANKEMIVEFGEEIMQLVHGSDCKFIPVDSEHNAIFQILDNRNVRDVEKITLTCSGGPFFNRPDLKNITIDEALSHPKWKMGKKITIDSATLMNKAIEIIEAKYLFDLDPSQIEVLVHPECIVHGIVHFKDGSSIAHMGFPDMQIPISYALYYPESHKNNLPRFDLKGESLSFFEPDHDKFPSIKFAYSALKNRNAAGLRRANDEAVEKFLNEEIEFEDIFKFIKNKADVR